MLPVCNSFLYKGISGYIFSVLVVGDMTNCFVGIILEHYKTRSEDFEAKYKEATALNSRFEKEKEILDKKNR